MTTPSNAELRRTVERLIIENRNSLNDPTTNEPYDVKGIADDVVGLIQAREQQLLTELLNTEPQLTWKKDDGSKVAYIEVSVIAKYIEGL